VLAGVAAAHGGFTASQSWRWLVVPVCVVGELLAEKYPVKIGPEQKVNLGALPCLLAVLLLPPGVGPATAALSVLVGNWIVQRKWWESVFNAGNVLIAASLVALLGSIRNDVDPAQVARAGGASLLYVVVNLLVAVLPAALHRGRPYLQLVKQAASATWPASLTLAACAVSVAVLSIEAPLATCAGVNDRIQLADAERGFGIRTGGPLDMRFDASRGIPASELLATLDARELTALFKRYGEEPQAGRIARAIVAARATTPVQTAEDLASLVERVAPGNPRTRRRIHPATRVFQALRIAVNAELDALAEGLATAVDLLRPGGRLVVLSYHSLEDRIVKRFFAAERRGCVCPPELPVCVCGRNPRLRLVTRPSLTPTDAEIAANPRARSARLRAAERLAA